MKRLIAVILILLAAALLMTSCSKDDSLSGTWNATGGTDSSGRTVDTHGYFGEYKVALTFKKDTFTMNVEDIYSKDYSYEYKDGKITFTDEDEYISFSQGQGGKVTFNVKVDGKKMIWTLPGSSCRIEFAKE